MTTTPIAPTVVAYTNANPVPRTQVTSTMPGDAVTFTLYRIAAGNRVVVRGAVRALAASNQVFDYEVPFGIPITYQVITYDAGGIPSQASPASTPVTVAATDGWLQDPLDPTSGISISLSGPTAPFFTNASWTELRYTMDSSLMVLSGDAYPLALGNVRRAASDVPIEIAVDTPAQANDVRELLAEAFPLLLRVPADVGFLGGAVYFAAADVTERPHFTGVSIFNFAAVTVRAPGASIVVSPRVWDDLPADAATWDAAAVKYANWNALARGVQ